MAKKPHVPKFGDWDSNDNIQITACFENARKEKDGSVIKRNPNDPEDNPEAFKGMLGLESSAARPQHPYHATAGGSSTNNKKSSSTEKAVHRRNNLMNDQRKVSGGGAGGGNGKSTTSDSEKSNSDYAVMGRHRRERSDRRKSGLASSVGSDRSISQSQSGHVHDSTSSRPRSTSATSTAHHSSSTTDAHNRAASIPKFGDWDEKDPQSGDGYTIIFNKLKEKKDTASANKFPPPTPNKNWDTTANKRGQSSTRSSKICCCLSPSARE